jgi:hypothetical protein
MFIELVELRNCMEVYIICIQDDRVVDEGSLGSWSWRVCSASRMFEESSICVCRAITNSLGIKSVTEAQELAITPSYHRVSQGSGMWIVIVSESPKQKLISLAFAFPDAT